MVNFRKLLTPEQRKRWDECDKYYEKRRREHVEMTTKTLIASAKYCMTQMPGPYKYARGEPVYDAVFFHIIIPELFERLRNGRREEEE